MQLPLKLFLCHNRSDSGSKKQQRIFDLIEAGNFEREEAVESNFNNEIDTLGSHGTMVSPEITAVKVYTKESDKGVTSNQRTDIFPAKANLISLIEDIGGECLFL